MIDKILNLKNTNKILFWLLLPMVAVAFITKILMKINIAGAKKDLDNAEKETNELRREREELLKKADDLEKKAMLDDNNAEHHAIKAKEIREEIEKINKKEQDLNWHLKQ